MSKTILLTILIFILHSTFSVLQSQMLAPTPPMGWNSWNCFQADINEQVIKEIADAMVKTGMRDAGYQYLVLDDGWMASERDDDGNLQADPEKFPNGMKALGDYIHSRGLKYGIYECRGYLTCQGLPGSFEHEDADMAIFASWGIDYIKLDACYAEKNGRLTTEDLQIYKEAIDKTGRPMVLSISDFGNGAWVWGGKKYGQLWRTSYDIYPWIENVYHHAETSGGDLRIHPAFNGLWQFAGPGHWNDPDMLEIGNLKSEMEDKIHMSLWCMLAAPLMAGNDIRDMSDTVKHVLTAPEVIAINQDSRGHQGYKIFDNGKQIIYNKPLSDGTTAVLLFNEDTLPADVTVKWNQIGLYGKQKVRDLWARKNLGRFKNEFTAKQLPEHGQFLLKVGRVGSDLVQGPNPVSEEKYIATQNGFSYLSDLYYMMKYGTAPLYDRTPKGDNIKIGGVEYEKGLSTQHGSILLYKLAGNSNRFRAMVGLDDGYTGDGTGRFKVLNEDAFGGRVLFDSGLMTKDSLPKQIDIDVKDLDCIFLKYEGKETTGAWGNARLVGSWDSHKVHYKTAYIDSLIDKMDLIPIRINGDKDNRINIVIVNRWEKRDDNPYNNPEMKEEFLYDVKSSLLAAFTPGNPAAQTAYANYQQFFNLYALWWPGTPEWTNGVDSELMDAIRDRLFLPWKDEHTGWVTFLLMPNRDGGGGGAARNLEERIGSAVIAGKGVGKMLHEISHTCTSIGDEYTAAATGTEAIPAYTVSREYLRDKIKWKAWIDPQTPLPTPYTKDYMNTVGAFEGGQYHLTNYFRSSAQGCIMGAGVFDNTEKMCKVCEQRLSMRMYTLVYPIEAIYPADNELFIDSLRKQHFSVSRVHPEPDTQETKWILNGKVIASGMDEIEIELDKDRYYELVFSLRDTTSLIREDPPYGEFPYRETRWEINPRVKNKLEQPSYHFVWTDANPEYESGHRYEAEKASINRQEESLKSYFGASEQAYVNIGPSQDKMCWEVTAKKEDIYSIGFVYASKFNGNTNMNLWVNDSLLIDSLGFPATRPLETGWDIVKVLTTLKKGSNKICLGIRGESSLNIDYLWMPENPFLKHILAKRPMYFDLENDIDLKSLGKAGVIVKKPNPNFEYVWYRNDIQVFDQELQDEELSVGISFIPKRRGNYYVGARNKHTGEESSTRKGFYCSLVDAKRTRRINPDQVKSAKLLLWLDASDMNGDGEQDDPPPPRDPYKNWKDKASGKNGPFVLYKPNSLNGMGVTGFEMVWISGLEQAITNFQTVIMVYKESSMSFPGTTPFRALDNLIDLQTDSEFDDYKLLTKEFDSKVETDLKTTEGYWEGSLAEIVIYDGILTFRERKAVEAGLNAKWFSVK
ncbi:MAG: NPCBM/NEW2 domain-containing protein [Bacteroidales bacterium]|nr:NPCBM/NEW2 domain-containing protein [Bacteroidales bacterium]